MHKGFIHRIPRFQIRGEDVLAEEKKDENNTNEEDRKKTFKELTIKDNFMFTAVMSDKENCRRLLGMALGFPVKVVSVDYEYSIMYNPDYKGIRLDVLAVDDGGSQYNVEIQTVNRKIEKRSRYYHSQLDMKLLGSGKEYRILPDAYVIFICDYDPVGRKKYKYTFNHICREVPGYTLEDGSHTIFLSTRGENDGEVPEELVRFLKYVAADLDESLEDFEDDYVRRLQESIVDIKKDRGMESGYMLFEEMLNDERTAGIEKGRVIGREEGRIEGIVMGRKAIGSEYILDLLSDLGSVSDDLKEKIESEENELTLKAMHRLAARSESIEMFLNGLKDMND